MSFTRRTENFTCLHCGAAVQGNGYTNHCPRCLWARHVDVEPGDRLAGCGGLMSPLAARYVRGEYIIFHRCEDCGQQKKNRASPGDDRELLISLTTESVVE